MEERGRKGKRERFVETEREAEKARRQRMKHVARH